MPDVTIVIPNYNGIAYLGACLRSVEKQEGVSAEVLIVDNGSTDGSQEYIRTEFPACRLICLEKNYGFCRAVNEGFRYAGSEYVILLNNDTEIEPDFALRLLASIKKDRKRFSCQACMIQYHDHSKMVTGQYSPRRTLTQEELAAYNAVMDPAVRDESGDIVDFHIQPFSYFFSSYYKNVRNLNFEEFIRYFPDSGQATEAEFEALKKLDDWPFKRVARMEDMPVPIHRHTISSINEVLTRWGGITTSNLDTSGVCYLEEYDAYYTYTSDFNMFYFIAESGEQVGNYVYLRKSVENGNIAVLTLRLTPGTDEWQIVSHWRSGS